MREINALDTFQKDQLYFKSGKYISEPVSKELVSTLTSYLILFQRKPNKCNFQNGNKSHGLGFYNLPLWLFGRQN
jgi:hypothetical protein